MTNLEAAIAVITVPVSSYPSVSVEKALADQGLQPAGVYDSSNAKGIDFAAIKVLRGMLALTKISEGGFELQFSTEGIKAILIGLEEQYSVTTGPTIRARQLW